MLYGLIGERLDYSLSVPIHRELGNPDYRLYELKPEELADFLRNPDIGGLNITIPYKRDVIPLCQSLSEEARAIGSVNTIVPCRDGLVGHNTDFSGFNYMAKSAGISFAGKKTVIFGSGGVCQTVKAVASREGARDIVAISRSGEENYENLARHCDADILVNATPLGTYPQTDAMPADPCRFPHCSGVLDVVYNPLRTAFIMRAEELGIACAGGLSMLVAQAVESEMLFFGRSFDGGEIPRILKKLRNESGNIVLFGAKQEDRAEIGKALSRLTGRRAFGLERELEREEIAKVGKESGLIISVGDDAIQDSVCYHSLRQNGQIYRIFRRIDKNGRYSALRERRADIREIEINSFTDIESAAEDIWRNYLENNSDKRS